MIWKIIILRTIWIKKIKALIDFFKWGSNCYVKAFCLNYLLEKRNIWIVFVSENKRCHKLPRGNVLTFKTRETIMSLVSHVLYIYIIVYIRRPPSLSEINIFVAGTSLSRKARKSPSIHTREIVADQLLTFKFIYLWNTSCKDVTRMDFELLWSVLRYTFSSF